MKAIVSTLSLQCLNGACLLAKAARLQEAISFWLSPDSMISMTTGFLIERELALGYGRGHGLALSSF